MARTMVLLLHSLLIILNKIWWNLEFWASHLSKNCRRNSIGTRENLQGLCSPLQPWKWHCNPDQNLLHAHLLQLKESDCYCKDPDKTGLVFADCQVLKGGNLDKTYYIALIHECSVKEAMAGIEVLACFDPSVSKEAATIALLTPWDLIRTLVKLENIDLEYIAPYFPDNTCYAHISMITLPSSLLGPSYWTILLDLWENISWLKSTL